MTDTPYQSPTAHGSDSGGTFDISMDVRGLQVVTAALIVGVVTFSGVALTVNMGQLRTDLEFMTLFGFGFAILCFLAHLVVPMVMQRVQTSQISPQQMHSADDETRCGLLLPIKKSTHIITCALLEGAAFLNITVFFLEGTVFSLLAAGVMVFCIALRFPTESRIRSWMRLVSEDIQLR